MSVPSMKTIVLPVVPTRLESKGYANRVANAPDVQPIHAAIQQVRTESPSSPLLRYLPSLMDEYTEMRLRNENALHGDLQYVTSKDWRKAATLPLAIGIHEDVRTTHRCLREYKSAYARMIAMEGERIGVLRSMRVCAVKTTFYDPDSVVTNALDDVITRVRNIQTSLRRIVEATTEACDDSDILEYRTVDMRHIFPTE